MTSKQDNLKGRQPQRKMVTEEDSFRGGVSKRKTASLEESLTSKEDYLKGRKPITKNYSK